MNPEWHDVPRILQLLRPHALGLAAAAGLAVVVAACQGGLVWLARELFDRLPQGEVGHLPLLVVALFVVQGGARAGRTFLTRVAAIHAESALRQRLFAHLLRRAPSALAAEGHGDHLSRLASDVAGVRTAMGAAVTVVQRPLSALVLLGAAARLAPDLFGYALLALPPVAWVVARTGRQARQAAYDHAQALGVLEGLARDALEGLRVLQASRAEGRVQTRFAEASQAQRRAAVRTTRAQTLGPPLVEIAAASGVALVLGVGARAVTDGTMSAGSLIAFVVALSLLHEPLKGFAVAHGLWSQARGSLGRVWEALDRDPAPPDAPGAQTLEAAEVTLSLVGVTVDHGQGPTLREVTFALRPGEIVALCGPSGAGKTTIIDVIAGFCPHQGVVAWNGVPAGHFTLSSRRAHLALVEQDPFLPAGTVGAAVRLSAPEASDAQVQRALHLAGFDAGVGIFDLLPGGLDGAVGDGGRAVSGGERQRLALARALLAETPVLLLDEPTAHLDSDAELALLATLQRLAPGRTILLVTHRATTAAAANRTLHLACGQLTEGHHSEAAS